MELKLNWHDPIDLEPGEQLNLIYTVDFDRIPKKPGVYIFGILFGKNLTPLYIGKAGTGKTFTNLRERIHQHIYGSLQLMNKLKKYPRRGRPVLVVGEFKSKRGQQSKKLVSEIEKSLIRYAINNNFELFNVQGNRTVPADTIKSEGNRPHFLPEELTVEKAA